jgi:hypothetical protein
MNGSRSPLIINLAENRPLKVPKRPGKNKNLG